MLVDCTRKLPDRPGLWLFFSDEVLSRADKNSIPHFVALHLYPDFNDDKIKEYLEIFQFVEKKGVYLGPIPMPLKSDG